jgi:hypothetical protein
MLKQISPDLVRLAVLSNPYISPQTKFFLSAIESAAPTFDVQVTSAPVRTIADVESAIENFPRLPNGGLIVLADAFTALHENQITELASRYRLPAIRTSDVGCAPPLSASRASMPRSRVCVAGSALHGHVIKSARQRQLDAEDALGAVESVLPG